MGAHEQLKSMRDSWETVMRSCSHQDRHEVRDNGKRYHVCSQCLNVANDLANAMYRPYIELRKAVLAQRPKCQRCGVKPVTWRVAGFTVCGWCATAIKREHNLNCATMGNAIVFGAVAMVDTTKWAVPQLNAAYEEVKELCQ